MPREEDEEGTIIPGAELDDSRDDLYDQEGDVDEGDDLAEEGVLEETS
jgi:hypothetical protein